MRPHSSITIGKVFGIPIGLDFSWFLIFALITWMLATSYFPAEFHNWSTTVYWLVGAITSLLLFVSVMLHELGHSVIALRYKIPVKSITLFIFGGVASIASEPPSPVAEFWIALAGPIVSLALAGIFRVIEPLSGSAAPIFALAKYLAFINFILVGFNIIPGFPLDGGRVFRAIVWGMTKNYRKATLIAANTGRLIAFVFILLGVWQILGGSFASGLWIAFIGWFLESAANAQVQQQHVQDLLAGHTVSQAISFNYTIIPESTTLGDLANQRILGEGRRFLIVEDNENGDGKILGMVTPAEVAAVSREAWGYTRVSQVMIPQDRFHLVDADDDLWKVMASMDQEGIRQVPVIKNGQVLGVLSHGGIIRYLKSLRQSQA